MKKIALMSGAYVNAGDFLIEQRCQKLLERFINNAEIHILKRNLSYDDSIDELNQYDLILFGGGPGYQKNMYPNRMPFISRLNSLTPPVSIMGWGWKGRNYPKAVYHNTMSNSMINFLKFIEKQEIPLGCRDWYTLDYLHNNNIYNTIMTGCPAWYDLNYIDKLRLNTAPITDDNLNICISDPALTSNKPLMLPLITFLRKQYPKAKIQIILHRGITSGDKPYIKKSFLEENNLSFKDISGCVESFQIYNNCNLHIGFRVHAHIYNLSRGNVSVLINEDMRGNGVNDALGIRNINLNSYKKYFYFNTADFLQTLNDYLMFIENSQYLQYINACKNIQFYYSIMANYLNKLGEII